MFPVHVFPIFLLLVPIISMPIPPVLCSFCRVILEDLVDAGAVGVGPMHVEHCDGYTCNVVSLSYFSTIIGSYFFALVGMLQVLDETSTKKGSRKWLKDGVWLPVFATRTTTNSV